MKRNFLKNPVFRYGRLAALAAVFFAFISCAGSFSENSKSEKQSIKVMNWNLQTFFDPTFDGNEYAEYKNSKSGWGKEKYEIRLERLASAIKKIDADVIIMEELEKEGQLQDIANRLSGTFDFKKNYTHGLFAANESSSIGCAVLSKLPLEEITVHSIDDRTKGKQPSMRPIIQFTLRKKDSELTVFVNHWKSKAGGEKDSEIWRREQENLLSNLMSKAEKRNHAVLAAGDFNKDISEFTRFEGQDGKTNLVLHGESNFCVFSPWILKNGEYFEGGSYWYKNEWERIDHFFAAGDIELENFCPETLGEWADSEGHPFRYQIWNGKGYSDHLPISCTVKF